MSTTHMALLSIVLTVAHVFLAPSQNKNGLEGRFTKMTRSSPQRSPTISYHTVIARGAQYYPQPYSPQPQIRTREGFIKSYPGLIQALFVVFWVGDVWFGNIGLYE